MLLFVIIGHLGFIVMMTMGLSREHTFFVSRLCFKDRLGNVKYITPGLIIPCYLPVQKTSLLHRAKKTKFRKHINQDVEFREPSDTKPS
jgi:hypothetical protein